MRTGAERLDELKVVLSQHFGRMANGLLLRVNVDLVKAQRVLLGLPLRQMVLLFLARLVHGRISAVVQGAGMRRFFLVPVVLHGVEHVLEGSRHGNDRS